MNDTNNPKDTALGILALILAALLIATWATHWLRFSAENERSRSGSLATQYNSLSDDRKHRAEQFNSPGRPSRRTYTKDARAALHRWYADPCNEPLRLEKLPLTGWHFTCAGCKPVKASERGRELYALTMLGCYGG